jgi:hypothetical protein
MSATSRESTNQWAGATLEDCIKLWDTIHKELMSDARIEMMLPTYVEPKFAPCIIITTEGWSELDGKPVQRVWSTRVLGNMSLGFTYNALYECLIVAYRGMDGFLHGQQELPASE